MPLRTTCTNCQKTLQVPDNVAGKKVRCPACQGVFTVAPQPVPAAVQAVPVPPPLPPPETVNPHRPPGPPPMPPPHPALSPSGGEGRVRGAPVARGPVKPVAFPAVLQKDPQKALKGSFQARVDEEGLELKGKQTLHLPVGTPARHVKGNVVELEIDGRPVTFAVGRIGQYTERLARDLAGFLSGRGGMDPAGYNLPWYFFVLAALPVGIPLITRGGAIWGALGGGLAAGGLALAAVEKIPKLARLFAILGLSVVGYGVLAAVMLLGRPDPPPVVQGPPGGGGDDKKQGGGVAEWRDFGGDGFNVEFPVDPKHEIFPREKGVQFHRYRAAVEKPAPATASVHYVDLDDLEKRDIEEIEGLLSSFADRQFPEKLTTIKRLALFNGQATWDLRRPKLAGGDPDGKDGAPVRADPFEVRQRRILLGTRIYYLTVACEGVADADEYARRLFGSFQPLAVPEARNLPPAFGAKPVVVPKDDKDKKDEKKDPPPGGPYRTLPNVSDVVGVGFNKDGTRLLTGHASGDVRTWSFEKLTQLDRLDGPAGQKGFAFHVESGRAVSLGEKPRIYLWDLNTGKIETTGGAFAKRYLPQTLALAPDGERFVVASETGMFEEFNFVKRNSTGKRGKVVVGAMAYSPAGDRMVAGRADGDLEVFRMPVFRSERKLTGHEAHEIRALAVAVAAGEGEVVAASKDLVHIWDLASGKFKETLKQPGPVACLAVSRDGTRMAVGAESGAVVVWDLAVRQSREVFEQAVGPPAPMAVAFTPDRRWLAVTRAGRLHLMELGSGNKDKGK